MSHHLDLPLTLVRDHHLITQIADSSIDLDAVLEELLEGADIEDLVACGLGGVDDELVWESALLCMEHDEGGCEATKTAGANADGMGKYIPSS